MVETNSKENNLQHIGSNLENMPTPPKSIYMYTYYAGLVREQKIQENIPGKDSIKWIYTTYSEMN